MTRKELDKILELHKMWLNGDENGKRADLRGADLRGADLYGADLRGANLRGADLYGANLRGANLRGADLRGADLYGADLRGANLRGADLYGANLRGADLRDADLYGADLDFSCWPLWCGGLGVKIDDRIARQLIYHVCSAVVSSPEISDSIKSVMLSRPVLDIANKFHRVDECGILKKEE